MSNNSKKKKNPFGRNGKKARLFHKAIHLYEEDYKLTEISKACNVHTSTLRRWFREAGLPPKLNGNVPNPKPYLDDQKEVDPKKVFDGFEERKAKDVVDEANAIAKAEEENKITNLAGSQSTPADQYQSYMASNSVKLMRDGLKNMAPPKNVREMEVLDKIARRHFGLDQRESSGVGNLSIDISILNDAAATTRTKVTKKPAPPSHTIDID